MPRIMMAFDNASRPAPPTNKTTRRDLLRAGVLAGASLLVVPSGLLAAVPADGRPYDFYSHGPYRGEVPKPSAILGYECGDTHTTFRDQERVVLAVAEAAKDRVRVWEYGRSVEGRPLRIVAISSPENIARLEDIRGRVSRLADPRNLSAADEAAILRDTPALTWINECIHGSETASFETAMWALYTLAASEAPEITAALRDSVVLLNPVFNPDGHERFVVYYNSVAVGSPEGIAFEQSAPWGVAGRFNHYRFDMNRDKIAQSQPEVRQETREFLRWNPQVFIDQHGQPEVYFFPPNALPSNKNVDRARVEKWTDAFGRANGAAFDRYGWSYVTRETFDLLYPGYLDSFTTLCGAIGMTYETDGGGTLARRRDDNTVSTLRDAAARHLETALASVVTAAKNRGALLRDFVTYRRGALNPPASEKLRRVVVLPGRDPGRAAEFAAHLAGMGVEVRRAAAGFGSSSAHAYFPADPKSGDKAAKRTFPAGSLVIDLAQPQGRLARALLEPDADIEPEFVKEQLARRERNEKRGTNERREDYQFYDTTAWSLPLAYGLEAYWTEDAAPVNGPLVGATELPVPAAATTPLDPDAVAYLIPFDRDAAAVMALRLLQEGFRLSAATRPLRAGGQEWPRGTVVARSSRNPAALPARLRALGEQLAVPVFSVTGSYGDALNAGLGSETVVTLKAPRIAVAADDNVSHTSFGGVWHLLDRAGVKFTSVRLRRLRGAADLARFNVIVLPDGGGYLGALGKEGVADLKEWVERGNVLVGLGGGGTWFTEKDAGLTTSRAVGADEEEEGGEDGDGEPEEEPGPSGGKPSEADGPPARKPKKPVPLPGALFRARIDPEHFLGFGYPEGALAVPLSGDTFLTRSRTGANVISFGRTGPARLSGFVWPDNTEPLLANTAYVVDEPHGRGHALLFLEDPTSRALWPGLRRLFLSGLLYGPKDAPFLPTERE